MVGGGIGSARRGGGIGSARGGGGEREGEGTGSVISACCLCMKGEAAEEALGRMLRRTRPGTEEDTDRWRLRGAGKADAEVEVGWIVLDWVGTGRRKNWVGVGGGRTKKQRRGQADDVRKKVEEETFLPLILLEIVALWQLQLIVCGTTGLRTGEISSRVLLKIFSWILI